MTFFVAAGVAPLLLATFLPFLIIKNTNNQTERHKQSHRHIFQYLLPFFYS
jgi:hypothetical protein